MKDDKFWTHFFEIFEAIPRQGVGDRESTGRALGLVPPLTGEQRILDIGCGSGAQTLDLASMTGARIVAVDIHPPFIDRLRREVAARHLEDRIDARVADMNDLPFADGSFDLVWSEGAIFIIGFSRGLAGWRRLLAPGGHMVVSEYCWFRDDPPQELVAAHTDGCTDVGDVEARRRAIESGGYELLADFVLPARCWWENFYVPLGRALESFRGSHEGDPGALAVAEHLQHEIDLYERYRDYFGYVFFVMRPAS